jgi:AraC-like DNA-binding protein
VTESRSATPRRRESAGPEEPSPHPDADESAATGSGPETGASSRGLYSTGVRRRAEIVAAAVRVFGVRGYGAATIKEIADEVGVSPAAVLRYFRKEELLTSRSWRMRLPASPRSAPSSTSCGTTWSTAASSSCT